MFLKNHRGKRQFRIADWQMYIQCQILRSEIAVRLASCPSIQETIMHIKPSALGAAALLALFTLTASADPLDAQTTAVSLGVNYRVTFGGSPMVRPEAPTFGFTMNVTRPQDSFSMGLSQPAVAIQSSNLNSILDIRFDQRTESLRALYVGSVNVLKTVSRVNVDEAGTAGAGSGAAGGVVDYTISWPLVGLGIVGVIAGSDYWLQGNTKKSTCGYGPTFGDTPDALNATYCGPALN